MSDESRDSAGDERSERTWLSLAIDSDGEPDPFIEQRLLRKLAPGGPWGGYPGRGNWRFPKFYDVDTVRDPRIVSNTRVHLGVQAFETALFRQGFLREVPDGNFDAVTELAVRKFQAFKGAEISGPVDGQLGPKTARPLIIPYFIWFQAVHGVPDNITVGQCSWEGGRWDAGVEGQLDPRDRGLGQWNSRWRPEVTDVKAYDILWASNQMAAEQAGEAARLNVLRGPNVRVNKWDLAIMSHKGPSVAETCARTGQAPPEYFEYVEDVRGRAILERNIPT